MTAPEGAPRAVIVTVGDELLSGLATFRTYRQFKMYNDPESNPAVRAARRGPEASA